MWDRDLVSRLSPKASQVLLSLLLSRSLEVQYSSAEFAALTGLGQRSIAPALFELRSYGLIDIVPQPGKPPLVRLVHPEEYRYETTVTEADIHGIETPVQPVLQGPGTGDSERVGAANKKQATDDSGGSGGGLATLGERTLLQRGDDEEIERGLLNNCQLADQGQDAGLRVAALQDVWSYAFPVEEYPYQRLSNDAAKRLLHPTGQVNRTAEWVGGVILDAVRTARSKIVSPRAYIEKIVASAETRATKYKPDYSDQSVITDEVRRAAQLGKELFGGEKKNSSTDL